MQHEDHIERYTESLKSVFKENEAALVTLYKYLKNSCVDSTVVLKKEIYKNYYYFEINHNIRDFNPILKEMIVDPDKHISVIFNENTLSVCTKSLRALQDIAEQDFKLNCISTY